MDTEISETLGVVLNHFPGLGLENTNFRGLVSFVETVPDQSRSRTLKSGRLYIEATERSARVSISVSVSTIFLVTVSVSKIHIFLVSVPVSNIRELVSLVETVSLQSGYRLLRLYLLSLEP